MERESLLNLIPSGICENEGVREKYAEHLTELFALIPEGRIGTEYDAAIEDENYAAAIKLLADYFRKRGANRVNALSGVGNYDETVALKMTEGYAREVNVNWHFEGGEIDFLFNPTEIEGPVNHEWLWQFNRHYYWADMARAYTATGDERYALAFSSQLLKWIGQTYIPEKWNNPGSAWRTIECGLRLLGSWQVAFDGFRHSDSIPDAVLLLMVASMHRQAAHLVAHPTKGNWLMMEMNGVYTHAALFPELSDSAEYLKIATDYLLKEIKTQVLPDGIHDELSPDYQSVVSSCAASFILLARDLGRDKEIPEEFYTVLRSTIDSMVALTTPAFTQPRTNDTFTIRTASFAERGLAVFGEVDEYKYVATKRKEGAPPKDYTSIFMPYGGFAVMRSGWDADATYGIFDVGPLGMAHMHQDKLNINVYKGDEELIFDDGGGQYEISDARDYAISAYGHNTVLVDGLGQYRKEPKRVTEPIDAAFVTNDNFDYAAAEYTDTYGKEMLCPATHRREVKFFKPDMFLVTDTLSSRDGFEHDYELIFHLDTTRGSILPGYENAVISDFGRKYDVMLIPLCEEGLGVTLSTVSAQREPVMQGWYNGRNEAHLHEAITVIRRAPRAKDFRFATLIIPTPAEGMLPTVRKVGDGIYEVEVGEKTYTVNVNRQI